MPLLVVWSAAGGSLRPGAPHCIDFEATDCAGSGREEILSRTKNWIERATIRRRFTGRDRQANR